MQILKWGTLNEPTWDRTCKRCSTEFRYNRDDIQFDMRDGNCVICPLCKTYISVDRGYGDR
jgi:uncharacterized Zn-finger protein